MKYFSTFFIALLLIGCSSNDDIEEIASNPSGGMNNGGGITTMQLMGNFVNGAHPTMGKVTVNSSQTTMSFQNFKTDNGPLLKVYLFETLNSTDYVDLGILQGTEGDFNYSIPTNTDLSKYKIVSIWCVQATVSFGHATLN